jgi:hypothetical protein
LTEDLIATMMSKAWDLAPSPNLVYAGGVALNCSANRILGEYFDNISPVDGKVFTSGSIDSEWLFSDWPITGSNQLPSPDTRLQITGDHPWNIQFVYATKLPIYRESPYQTYGSAYYLQQLNTVIKTYQSMLGR